MGALDGVMPMISFSLYTSVYHATVHAFPGAQFFFGASANVLMTIIFVIIIISTSSKSYSLEDLENCEGSDAVKPVSARFFKEDILQEHIQQQQNEMDSADYQRSVAILSNVNFHIATPIQRKRNPSKPVRLGEKGRPSVFVISEAHRKIVAEELCYPQKAVLPKQKDVYPGVDNPSFVHTENERK
ncbi:hypothetical protein SK128_014692, partial [Halocaridina rubra]